MAVKRVLQNKKTIAVVVILLVAGGMIIGSQMYLTSLRHEETLLSEEIHITYDLLQHWVSFNLTAPAAISYIQVIFIGTSIIQMNCRLFDIDGVEVWSSSLYYGSNYSSSWIEVVPGDYILDMDCGGLRANLTVLGRNSLPAFEQEFAEISNVASPIIGIVSVGLVVIIMTFKRFEDGIESRWKSRESDVNLELE